jgi:pimeloyl-ACP methyl ester carboxylesterase
MEFDLNIGGRKIEASWYGPKPDQAPALVLLHEGLGCVAMWRDFPEKLAERTGCGVLVYSRFGYGKSDPVKLPRPLSYMHDEALQVLPKVLDAAKIEKAILVGHSDGASIATIYAGGAQDFRVRGLVLMAPHFFVEDVSIKSIEAAKVAYETTDLRQRLAKYHKDVDVAFRGWNDAWLDPGFREWRIEDSIAHVRVPMLLIQGENDEYGTLAQIELAQAESYSPADALMLKNCRHSPHADQPEAVLRGIEEFTRRLAAHEGLGTAA